MVIKIDDVFNFEALHHEPYINPCITNLVKQQAKRQEGFRSHGLRLRLSSRLQCSKQTFSSIHNKVPPIANLMRCVRDETVDIVFKLIEGFVKNKCNRG